MPYSVQVVSDREKRRRKVHLVSHPSSAVQYFSLGPYPGLLFPCFPSVLCRLPQSTAGGGPAVLRGILLVEAFLLPLDKIGEGGPVNLLVFDCLVLTQVLKEWYGLSDD